MRRPPSRFIVVALNLLCGSSAFFAGGCENSAPPPQQPGAFLTPQEEAILRRSYLRCASREHSDPKYAQRRRELELTYQHHVDDLTLRLTSRDIADAPKEAVQGVPYISCVWFYPPSPRPPG